MMNTLKSIQVFAPATVSNLGSGFDIIGFPIENVGDTVQVTQNEKQVVRITNISGYKDIPIEASKNVASYALIKLLEKLGVNKGFDIAIEKAVKPGSGIGSSASSSVAAVYAVNELLGQPFTDNELIAFAMEGEGLASGGKHADNVAPALLGGITVLRSYNPLDVIRIEPPEQLRVVLLHPQIEIKTREARDILPKQIPLKDAVHQWGNVAGLISGLYSSDYEMIGRSMEDVIVEPRRSSLIPGYDQLKSTALEAGALGCTISGSGPSVFALTKGDKVAKQVENAMKDAYNAQEIPFNVYSSFISSQGAMIIDK
jgi:homoserine kinase